MWPPSSHKYAVGVVLADDATGALECASLLAGLHLRTSITLNNAAAPGEGPGLQVADTESRHLPPEKAAARIREWLIDTSASIFKKTDSTLRGNIAAELLAMLEIRGARTIVYVPAYPALGRTVKDGLLFVHGTPVADTEFARDARHPVRTSRIIDLFPESAHHRIARIPDAVALAAALSGDTPRILICDAASNEDLHQLAAAIRHTLNRPWIAGPAGFIEDWAAFHPFPRGDPPALPRPRKWLVVCGSRHPQSRRQADTAEAAGLPVIRASNEANQSPDLVAAALAQRTLDYVEEQKPDAVLIMGGDTVWAVWLAMGITTLSPLPELLPGIASCFSPERNLLFVTKAGGFGDDRLVGEILERCNRT